MSLPAVEVTDVLADVLDEARALYERHSVERVGAGFSDQERACIEDAVRNASLYAISLRRALREHHGVAAGDVFLRQVGELLSMAGTNAKRGPVS